MSKSFSAKLVADSFHERFGGTKQHADDVVYFFQELIQQELYRGVPINFPMIGKFHPIFKKAHKARNPKTGEAVQAPAKHTVRFKPSTKMIAWMNKNR